MGVPGFDLAVYLDGECILRRKAGFSDLENRVPIRGDERYNIYSCSKPITCVAAMQLWEKGLFSLEDRLSDYMEEFAEMHVKMPDGDIPPRKARSQTLLPRSLQISSIRLTMASFKLIMLPTYRFVEFHNYYRQIQKSYLVEFHDIDKVLF